MRETSPAPSRSLLMRSYVQASSRFGRSSRAARLFLALALVGPLPFVLGGTVLRAAPDADQRIKKLIEQLGDDKTKVRQEASKKLEEIGEPALGPLRAATTSHVDVDVRLRASVVAATIHKKLNGE